MKELLIMAKSLGGGGSEVALIELINALPEELYNITLVLLDSDNEYAYRLKKKVNIVQLTFNCSFAKSLVSMYAFPAKVLKKLSVNSFIPYYDFISNCVTNVFEKTYDVAIDFYGYGSFVTAFLATKIQAKKKATWIHDEKPYWMKSVQKYLCEYDKIYGVSQAVVDAFCREYPHYKDKAAVFYNVIDIEEIKRKSEQDEVIPFKDSFNIVTVGRLTEQKGYDIAIKAASILKKRKINFVWYAIVTTLCILAIEYICVGTFHPTGWIFWIAKAIFVCGVSFLCVFALYGKSEGFQIILGKVRKCLPQNMRR